MNRVYKVIWSKARGALVAVSEIDTAGERVSRDRRQPRPTDVASHVARNCA